MLDTNFSLLVVLASKRNAGHHPLDTLLFARILVHVVQILRHLAAQRNAALLSHRESVERDSIPL